MIFNIEIVEGLRKFFDRVNHLRAARFYNFFFILKMNV